ncbi:MAG: ABC transporter ATP-binding protein [Candidatus Eisenbacteria bacterium]
MRWDENPHEEGYVPRLSVASLLRRILARLRSESRAMTVGIGLLLLSVAAELAGPLIIRRIIDRDIPEAARNGATAAIWESALFYLAIFVLGSLANFRGIVVIARVGLRLIARLKQDCFDHLLGLGADYFDHHPPGRLLARVESDAERLLNLFSDVSIAILRSVLLLGGTLVVMYLADARITTAVILLAAPVFAISLVLIRWMRTLYAEVRRAFAQLSTFVAEYVQAVPILQVYGRQSWVLDRLHARNLARYRIELRSEFINYAFWSGFATLEVVAVMLILYLGFGGLGSGGAEAGASRGALRESLSLGTLVLFIEYTRRLFTPLVMFAEQLNSIQRAFASADRVFGILQTETRVRDRRESGRPVPAWSEIAFENVEFRYEEGDAPRPVLDGVSFRIRRGEHVALVGPSGGGKSTLTSLLLRFYEPTAGRITVDGIDIRELPLVEWRRRLGLVLQDIHLFPGSVADNLRVFAHDVPEAQLLTALQKLEADEILRDLPAGLATSLAEGGQNLSMGERQLLCFARALVKDPEILVLDEATSSVDPATERRMQRSMQRLMAGRTALVVAHRLSTVVHADHILVLEAGRLVEEGTHTQLLARGGLYGTLYRLQFQAGEVA